MKTCPQCGANQAADNASSCPSCGFSFVPKNNKQTPPPDDDKLDFVVTEKDNDDREFVGGQKDFNAEDGIRVESPEEILEKEATSSLNDTDREVVHFQPDIPPIGQSEPLLPPETPETPETANPVPEMSGNDNKDIKQPETAEKPTGGIKKLSEEEVKEIEKNLYRKSSYLDEKAKQELVNKLDAVSQPFGNTPISPHKNETETPPPPPAPTLEQQNDSSPPYMAERGRGIAYFYKNYVQLATSQKLHPEEELQIGDRIFELKPKKLNPKIIIAGAATLFILMLVVIGSFFITDTSGDNGEIVGIVLDDNNVPFLQGAVINFPTLKKTVKSNSQGFFKSGNLPAGTYKIELVYDNETIGTDYATIVGGKVSTVVLRPGTPEQAEPEIAQVSTSAPPTSVPDKPVKIKNDTKSVAKAERTKTVTQKKTTRKKSSKKKKAKRPKSTSPSKLTLAANIEGAKLKLDGSTVGAGNLTYKNLKPAKHKYEVTKNGYQTVTGTITLKPGKTSKLVVELAPLSEEEKRKSYTAEDFYYSGMTLFQNEKYSDAIADLSEAVNQKPSYAEAYMSLGKVYAKTKEWTKAHDNFIKAAEIFKMKKDYSRSVTAYNLALDSDSKSVTAYLGRANVFMLTHENRAAVLDFESVLKLDKRNSQAYYGLGEARFRQGYYKKAIKNFKNARSVDSKNPLIQQYLMLCYMAVDDYKNVKKSYKKFLNLASEKDIQRLRADSRFTAVLRVAENEH